MVSEIIGNLYFYYSICSVLDYHCVSNTYIFTRRFTTSKCRLFRNNQFLLIITWTAPGVISIYVKKSVLPVQLLKIMQFQERLFLEWILSCMKDGFHTKTGCCRSIRTAADDYSSCAINIEVGYLHINRCASVDCKSRWKNQNIVFQRL